MDSHRYMSILFLLILPAFCTTHVKKKVTVSPNGQTVGTDPAVMVVYNHQTGAYEDLFIIYDTQLGLKALVRKEIFFPADARQKEAPNSVVLCEGGNIIQSILIQGNKTWPIVIYAYALGSSTVKAQMAVIRCKDEYCQEYDKDDMPYADAGYLLSASKPYLGGEWHAPYFAFFRKDSTNNKRYLLVLCCEDTLCKTFRETNILAVDATVEVMGSNLEISVGKDGIPVMAFDYEITVTNNGTTTNTRYVQGLRCVAADCWATPNAFVPFKSSEFFTVLTPAVATATAGDPILTVIVYVTDAYNAINALFCTNGNCSHNKTCTVVSLQQGSPNLYSLNAVANDLGDVQVMYFMKQENKQNTPTLKITSVNAACQTGSQLLLDSQGKNLTDWDLNKMQVLPFLDINAVSSQAHGSRGCKVSRGVNRCPVIYYNVVTDESSRVKEIFCPNPDCAVSGKGWGGEISVIEQGEAAKFYIRIPFYHQLYYFWEIFIPVFLLDVIVVMVAYFRSHKTSFLAGDVHGPFLSQIKVDRKFRQNLRVLWVLHLLGSAAMLTVGFFMYYDLAVYAWLALVPPGLSVLSMCMVTLSERKSSVPLMFIVVFVALCNIVSLSLCFNLILSLMSSACTSVDMTTTYAVIIFAIILLSIGQLSVSYNSARMAWVIHRSRPQMVDFDSDWDPREQPTSRAGQTTPRTPQKTRGRLIQYFSTPEISDHTAARLPG